VCLSAHTKKGFRCILIHGFIAAVGAVASTLQWGSVADALYCMGWLYSVWRLAELVSL